MGNGAETPHNNGPQPRKKRTRVIRQGTEREVVSGVSRDEQDSDWAASGNPSDSTSNDAELLTNVPPHWGRGQ